MTIKPFLVVAIAPFLLLAAPAWAQKQAEAAPSPSPEAALAAVARHLSDAYALYLYESLTAQVLSNEGDRKSTRLNSSHGYISYAVFCLKKKKKHANNDTHS